MSASQDRIVARLQRLVSDAKRDGIALVADAGSSTGGIRVMTAQEAEEAPDLRAVGVYVALHNGCGGQGSDKSGGGKWM